MGLATIIFIIGALLLMLAILPKLPTTLLAAKGQADIQNQKAAYDLAQQKQNDSNFQKKGVFGSIGDFFLGTGNNQSNPTASDKSNNTSSPNKNVGSAIIDAGERGSSLYKVANEKNPIYLRPDEVAYYQKKGVKVSAVSTNFIQDIQHGITQVTS